MSTDPNVITLSLISHTNVGKTTLTRTLLRRDVGEVLDQAHVTIECVSYTMIESDGAELRLWDTPGFGDTARLLKRLRKSGNPIVWFVTQAWDRVRDRPFWCSQQAFLNVRDEADVVLYLVSSAEDPHADAYVEMELEILQWIGKPVVVLVNQVGPDSGEDRTASWRERLRDVEAVRSILPLDAFARCWVQEGRLLAEVARVLPPEQREAFAELRAAWRERNLRVFEDSMNVLAELLAEAAIDSEQLGSQTLVQKLGINLIERKREMREARDRLADRLAARSRDAMNRLIKLHDLEGESLRDLEKISRTDFEFSGKLTESLVGLLNGAATGALGGLLADFHAGGLTLGGGAVAGGILGGAGGYGVARALNVIQDRQNRLRLNSQRFLGEASATVLGYLAVAHYGRGRGAWSDADFTAAPWVRDVAEAVETRREKLAAIWKRAAKPDAEQKDKLAAEFRPVVASIAQDVLQRRYPDAADVFREM